MALFDKALGVNTIKVDYMELVNIFDRFFLVPEYESLWDPLLKKFQGHYWGTQVTTPDNKFEFYMSATSYRTSFFGKKYIWIMDKTTKDYYELKKPTQYREFRKAAANAIINKRLAMRGY